VRTNSRFAGVLILIFAGALFIWQQESHSQSLQAGVNDWSELMESMEKMHVAMTSIERTGDSDVDFVRLMLPHHEGAIDMAKAQLMHGKDPQMRRLAQEIITDQQSEIELMQLWLKQHGSGSADRTSTAGVSKEH
jgi:uncharacterized protein (DUF305 family)